jgi:hypothetical protein
MTIDQAINKINGINDRNPNDNLRLAAEKLGSISKILDDSYELKDELSKLVEQGQNKYNTNLFDADENVNNFKKWCEGVYRETLDFAKFVASSIKSIDNARTEGQNYLDKKDVTRKKWIGIFLVVVLVIAIACAVVSILATIKDWAWGDPLATCLGTIDFAVGIFSFSLDRISNIDSQKVSRSLEEMEQAQTTDLNKAIQISEEINKIVIKTKESKSDSVGGSFQNAPGSDNVQISGKYVQYAPGNNNCQDNSTTTFNIRTKNQYNGDVHIGNTYYK